MKDFYGKKFWKIEKKIKFRKNFHEFFFSSKFFAFRFFRKYFYDFFFSALGVGERSEQQGGGERSERGGGVAERSEAPAGRPRK